MGKGMYHAVFVPALIAAIFMAVFLKTGQDVSPEGLATQIGDEAVKSLGDESSARFWTLGKVLILVISLVATVIDIFLIIAAGWPTIFVAVGGYLGMLFLIMGWVPKFGAILLVGAEILCLLAPDTHQ